VVRFAGNNELFLSVIISVDILIQLWVHCEQTAVAVCSSILEVTLCNLLHPLLTCNPYGTVSVDFFKCFVDHGSRYNHVKKKQLDAQLILSIVCQSLHVLGLDMTETCIG